MRITISLVILVLTILSCAKANDPFKPEQPLTVMQIERDYYIAGEYEDMAISGNRLFIAEATSGFSEYNITSGSLLHRIDHLLDGIIPTNFSNITHLEITDDGKNLYVYDRDHSGNGNLQHFNIENDSLSYVLKITGATNAYSDLLIETVDDKIMLSVTRNSSGEYDLVRGELSGDTIGNQTSVRFRERVGNFRKISNKYYISEGLRGIVVVDSESNELIDEIDTPGEALDVSFKDGYIFVADRQDGLQVIDYTGTEHNIIYNYNTTGYAQSIAINGNYAAVASGGGGVYLFDISDINQIKMIHRMTSSDLGYCLDVKFYDEYLYVGSRDLGVVKLSINK